MKKLKQIIPGYSVSLLVLLIFSCNPTADEQRQVCDEENTTFSLLYQDLLANGFRDTLIDLTFHEYTFHVTAEKEICKVGFQSNPNVDTSEYMIEIIDTTTDSLLFRQVSTFTSDSPSYIPVDPAIALQPFRTYKVRSRKLTDLYPDTKMAICNCTEDVFPVTYSDLSVTGSSFGALAIPPDIYSIVPFIDVVMN